MVETEPKTNEKTGGNTKIEKIPKHLQISCFTY